MKQIVKRQCSFLGHILRKGGIEYQVVTSGAGKGGKGGGCPPNVEKDGPRNSSEFDEKIGRECVSISEVKKS